MCSVTVWSVLCGIMMSVLCSGTEKHVSGPDFNGIERVLVVYRWPFGLAASEALATQHYRRRFESCHRTLLDCHRPSVSELEPACALPRCHGAFFLNGRADECCGLLIFWLEHEMHFNASLLIGTPEESEVFCTTQGTLAIDTLQQAFCCLWACCRRRRHQNKGVLVRVLRNKQCVACMGWQSIFPRRVLCSISRPIAYTLALDSGAGLNALARACLRLHSVFHRRLLCSISATLCAK